MPKRWPKRNHWTNSALLFWQKKSTVFSVTLDVASTWFWSVSCLEKEFSFCLIWSVVDNFSVCPQAVRIKTRNQNEKQAPIFLNLDIRISIYAKLDGSIPPKMPAQSWHLLDYHNLVSILEYAGVHIFDNPKGRPTVRPCLTESPLLTKPLIQPRMLLDKRLETIFPPAPSNENTGLFQSFSLMVWVRIAQWFTNTSIWIINYNHLHTYFLKKDGKPSCLKPNIRDEHKHKLQIWHYVNVNQQCHGAKASAAN